MTHKVERQAPCSNALHPVCGALYPDAVGCSFTSASPCLPRRNERS